MVVTLTRSERRIKPAELTLAGRALCNGSRAEKLKRALVDVTNKSLASFPPY
jgi:hypothetical protein